MKYMLILIGQEGGWQDASPEDVKAEMDGWAAFGQEVNDAGAYVAGEGLQESATATTVRFEGGERSVTDGPFAETKEQVGGFYVLECKDLDEALEWAHKIPYTNDGAVEIRPVMDYEAMGYEGPEQQEAARS